MVAANEWFILYTYTARGNVSRGSNKANPPAQGDLYLPELHGFMYSDIIWRAAGIAEEGVRE